MNVDDIIKIAKTFEEEKLFNKDLEIVITLDDDTHKKLNEELYYRLNENNPDSDLEYGDEIELEILDVNFKFLKNND